MTFKSALREDDLWVGEMTCVAIDGRSVLVVNVEGTVCAYENRCRHRALPLSLGKLTGNRLVCAAHGWEYDACTGEGTNPLGVSLRRYVVQIVAGEIQVDIGTNHEAGDV